MTRIRSLLFMLWLYGSMFIMGLICSPLLLLPRRVALGTIKLWARMALGAAHLLCGIKVEFRGLEHRPQGAALIAGKHMSMLDTIAPFVVLDDPCYVLKKELMALPFFGWFAARSGMVPVRREDAAKALKQMVADCRDRLTHARQIVIFPEGTRADPGADADYKPGVAALYRDLEVPCHLLATNSGRYWPGHGIDRHAGTVVYEFLPPLPAGMKRPELMREMKTRIEEASNTLLRG
ncbi:MAG: lysophospholipid acyltransferase family protein [Asticcacaulis sp.]